MHWPTQPKPYGPIEVRKGRDAAELRNCRTAELQVHGNSIYNSIKPRCKSFGCTDAHQKSIKLQGCSAMKLRAKATQHDDVLTEANGPHEPAKTFNNHPVTLRVILQATRTMPSLQRSTGAATKPGGRPFLQTQAR